MNKNFNNNNNSNRQYSNRNTYSEASTIKHKNIICNYCSKHRHSESECRKKKRDMNPSEVINSMTELACLVKDLPSDTNQTPKYGYFTGCGKVGFSFQFCSECGSDSGMFHEPNPDITDLATDSGNRDDDDSDDEYNYTYLKDMSPPKFYSNWRPEFINSINHDVSDIPLEEVFQNIWKNSIKIVGTIEMEMNEYVRDRVNIMKTMGYNTVSLIIRNHDNIKYNVHYFNKYYLPMILPSQRPMEWTYISDEEIAEMNIWCAHSIQAYMNQNMVKKGQNNKLEEATDEI